MLRQISIMHKNSALAEMVRKTAYFLWENDGRPPGRSFDYWLRAKEMHLRQLAYDKWLADGTPHDRADRHWHEARHDLGEK